MISAQANSTQTPHHSSFEFISSTLVPSLNLTVEHYQHKKTGAVHYHLACDHQEKVFSIALRTMPKDSSGVAHILEHTALCGSDKYPVRDPFFMMTRRSLNTFMNAMTSSDWTAYPFASQNDKDFDNLLHVYLDAVFFARLDELDFAQEGHRVEFSDASDSSTPLVYKGVVFNEMKGAMSSAMSQLWQKVSKHLFPTNTYHFNSGGEPAEIPDLSYQQLLTFYKTHYHPSNAIIMTFGDLKVDELQATLDSQALSRFEKQTQRWSVPLEQRMPAPLRIEEAYALDVKDDSELNDKTHHVLAWLLGESADLKSQLEAHLMSQVLLDNSASPLRKALEQCDFATSPSGMCGLEDSNREMSFLCGVEGSSPEAADKFEALVFEVLNQVAEEGVNEGDIASAMHQLEFHQREIGGDGSPYGLQLIFSGMSAATHYGDPVAMINLDPALEALKEDIKQPNFFQNLVRKLLLDNRHHVRLTMRPDAGLSQQETNIETNKLERMKSAMSDEQKQAVIDQAAALKQRQQQLDDDDILPSVGLSDVPAEIKQPERDDEAITKEAGLITNATSYSTGTNGIVYQQILSPLPELSLDELKLLPLLSYAWTEVGVEGSDYLNQQQVQASICGDLSSYTTIKPKALDADGAHEWLGYYTFSSKALASNINDFSQLLKTTRNQSVFSEHARITDLIGQYSGRRLQGVTGSGHSLAMQLASAQVNESAALMNELSGLPFTRRLQSLQQQVSGSSSGQQASGQDVAGETVGKAAQSVESVAQQLQMMQQKISDQPVELLLIQDQEQLAAHSQGVAAWSAATPAAQAFQPVLDIPSNIENFWQVDTQVNFCAQAFATVNQLHPDAPALAVASGVLRNGFLHTSIREQGGAYGAGASQDSTLGIFKFYSYRDPRIEGTFDDFKASVRWLLDDAKDESLVEQSILGIIGSMDRPGSPAGEAKQLHHALKAGRTQARRLAYRQGLLTVTLADVKRVAAQYLLNDATQGEGFKAVVAPKGTEAIAQALGLNATEL